MLHRLQFSRPLLGVDFIRPNPSAAIYTHSPGSFYAANLYCMDETTFSRPWHGHHHLLTLQPFERKTDALRSVNRLCGAALHMQKGKSSRSCTPTYVRYARLIKAHQSSSISRPKAWGQKRIMRRSTHQQTICP